MHLRSLLFSVALLLFLWETAGAFAQTLVPDEPSCRTCRLVVRSVLTFGDADGPGAFSAHPVTVKTDTRGRYWAVVPIGMPQIFASDGRFIGTAARKGQGPGELASGNVIIQVPGDSTLIMDNRNSRAVLFGPDLKFVRAIEIVPALGAGAVVRWPDLVFMPGNVQSSDRVGWPLHTVTFAGRTARVTHSSGHNGGVLRPGESYLLSSLVSVANGALWSAELARYRISQWDNDLKLLTTIERRPDWWRGPSTKFLGTPTQPPEPHIAGFNVDEEGLLWVFIHVPRDDWKSGWPSLPPGTKEVSMNALDRRKLVRTVIEVINPVQRRVLVRGFSDHFVLAALPGRRAATFGETGKGVPTASILSFAIERQ